MYSSEMSTFECVFTWQKIYRSSGVFYKGMLKGSVGFKESSNHFTKASPPKLSPLSIRISTYESGREVLQTHNDIVMHGLAVDTCSETSLCMCHGIMSQNILNIKQDSHYITRLVIL